MTHYFLPRNASTPLCGRDEEPLPQRSTGTAVRKVRDRALGAVNGREREAQCLDALTRGNWASSGDPPLWVPTASSPCAFSRAFSAERACRCWQNKHIYLQGSSSVRILFGAIVGLLNGTVADPSFVNHFASSHLDCENTPVACWRTIVHTPSNTRVTFEWRKLMRDERPEVWWNFVAESRQRDSSTLLLLEVGPWDFLSRGPSDVANNATTQLERGALAPGYVGNAVWLLLNTGPSSFSEDKQGDAAAAFNHGVETRYPSDKTVTVSSPAQHWTFLPRGRLTNPLPEQMAGKQHWLATSRYAQHLHKTFSPVWKPKQMCEGHHARGFIVEAQLDVLLSSSC